MSMESGANLPARVRFRHGVLIRGAIIAALGGLIFGFDTAVISGANKALQSVFQLTEDGLGFTVSFAMLGTLIGSFAIGKPSDAWGRKNALYLLAIFFFVSAVGCGLARNWWEFLFARFLGGLAIGGVSMVTPMYIAEISPPHLRGRLVMVNQLNIVIGIMLSYVSNYYIAQHFEFEVAWRWMLGLLAFPSAAFFFLIFSVPESPRSLAKRGRLAEARSVLERLEVEDAERELAAIQASLADRPGQSRERLINVRHFRPVLLAGAMAVFNQLTGINAILYYAPKIIGSAGTTADDSLWRSIPIGITLLLFTIVAMFFIDRFGRRVLLLIGSVGMALCLSIVSAAFANNPERHEWLILGGLMGSIAFFAMSQGAVMFVFISEIFPNAVRAKGQALGTFIHWSMAAIVTGFYPRAATYSVAGVFGFFAAMMALQFFFAWKIMPETKGGALEDIEKQLESGR
jgi:MFS transporter, SP family, xylose:H+ symportor